jgi:hypothetical protein
LTPKANCSRYFEGCARSIIYVKLPAPIWLGFQRSHHSCRMYVAMVAVAPVLDCRRWGFRGARFTNQSAPPLVHHLY